MRNSATTQCVLFEGHFRKPLPAGFGQAHASSDGVAVVLATDSPARTGRPGGGLPRRTLPSAGGDARPSRCAPGLLVFSLGCRT